jgi:hypothetical protein
MKSDEQNSLKRTGIFQGGGLAEAPQSSPSSEFWDTYKGLVTLDETGRLYFTVRGRFIYTPIFHKLGISLQDVRTVGDFERALQETLATQPSTESTRLRDLLASGTASESQKRITRRLLGIDASAGADIIPLAGARSRKTSPL